MGLFSITNVLKIYRLLRYGYLSVLLFSDVKCTPVMPKEFQYLSKRRKYQLLHRELDSSRYPNFLQSTVSNIVSNTTEEVIFNIENVQNCFPTSRALSPDQCEFHKLPSESESNTEDELSLESGSKAESCNVKLQHDVAVTSTFCDPNEKNLWQDLQTLIVEHNIPHNTANELLRIMKKHGHTELPNDVRVLVATPRNASVHISPVSGGHYIHFGLSSSLQRSIQLYAKFIKTNSIKLNINIDGLPIAKSSGSQLWPIMASIENLNVYTLPFIIGIFHGMCKPTNANDFLTPFVNEFLVLSQSGITVSDVTYSVAISAILCDAPARAFVTYTKGHTG